LLSFETNNTANWYRFLLQDSVQHKNKTTVQKISQQNHFKVFPRKFKYVNIQMHSRRICSHVHIHYNSNKDTTTHYTSLYYEQCSHVDMYAVQLQRCN